MPLFNGRNLDGWIGNLTGYKVEDGVMTFDPNAGDRSNLYTAKEYADFSFRFEFQLTPGANSGVGIRAPREGDAAYVGMEIQVLDDTAPVYATLQPYQYHGSVYGIIPAKRGALKPVGEWNTEEISYPRVAHHGDGQRRRHGGRRSGRGEQERDDRQEGRTPACSARRATSAS